jgi:hypothetical protein
VVRVPVPLDAIMGHSGDPFESPCAGCQTVTVVFLL